MTSAKTLQKHNPAVTQGQVDGKANKTAADITTALRGAQSLNKPSPESVAHEIIARVEAKTNEVPAKAARTGGADNRHLQKGRFSLQMTYKYAPSIFIESVIEHIPNGRLANEMAAKVCPKLMIAVFKALDHRSFSLIPKEMHSAREHVLEIFGANADAIAANLWMTRQPSLDTIMIAIKNRREIRRLFKNENELSLLEDKLTIATHCPGFLPIESSKDVLKQANGHGGLTYEAILNRKVEERAYRDSPANTMTLFSFLQRKGAEIFSEKKADEQRRDYVNMPMSALRVGKRVMFDSARYPLPKIALEHKHSVGADSVAFRDGDKVLYRSKIALIAPLGLQIVELEDGTLVAVVTGKAGSFVGLSGEEQEFLKPLYRAFVEKTDAKLDKVEERRRLKQYEFMEPAA